jgi:protein-disulfide isomerase
MKPVLAGLLAAIFCCAASGVGRNDIVEGNPSSPVRVIIYEDLQCSDCAHFRGMMDQRILPRYGDRIEFIHRDFPLPKHDWARQAAIAGRWVYEQNHALGIVYRREIMSEQDHLTTENLKDWLAHFAARNDLDPKGIVASLGDQRLASIVDADYQGAVARGVSKTPTVYVGNQSFVENIVYEDLAHALDQALE